MSNFITAVTDTVSGIFTAIIEAFSSVGNLLFTFTEGAITGVSPFGYLMALIIGVPLATWIVSKALGLIKSIRAK